MVNYELFYGAHRSQNIPFVVSGNNSHSHDLPSYIYCRIPINFDRSRLRSYPLKVSPIRSRSALAISLWTAVWKSFKALFALRIRWDKWVNSPQKTTEFLRNQNFQVTVANSSISSVPNVSIKSFRIYIIKVTLWHFCVMLFFMNVFFFFFCGMILMFWNLRWKFHAGLLLTIR